MRIGITYDLRDDYVRQGYSEDETAEFDAPETIDAIEGALTSLGHLTVRVGSIQNLAARLVARERWDLVFNYAEGLHGFGREAQVPALLDAFGIPYTFSDALVMALTLHKGMTNHAVRDMGVPTPDFVVVPDDAGAGKIVLPYPLFVKPVAGGSSVGISAASRVSCRSELLTVCHDLISRFRQPVLVQTFLPGRELTVGVVGTGPKARVLGVMEVLLGEHAEPYAYSYANKTNYEGRVWYRIVDDEAAADAAHLALRVWNGLGCRDAGRIDCRCDALGKVNFLEINPLAGLHPETGDLIVLAKMLAIDYRQLVEWIVDSAGERVVPVSRSHLQMDDPAGMCS